MNILNKKLLSGGLALYLVLSPVIATASPQLGTESITSTSVSNQLKKQSTAAVDTSEEDAVAAINSADKAEIEEAIVAYAETLGLELTKYNELTDQSPVHQALVGKRFRYKSAVRRSFDSAVTRELKKEVAAAVLLAVTAVNNAKADEMEEVITTNALTLGLDLRDYNLLTNKVSVHEALVPRNFRTASSIRSAFKSAVAKEKKLEAVVAEGLAVAAVNKAKADEMEAALTANALTLGLDLRDYNLLSNQNPVHIALVGRNFKNKAAVKKAFSVAVAKEKAAEKTTKAAAISKIERIVKGASAAGITIQDLINAGVKAEDLIQANLALYQAAISAAPNLALNSTAKIQQMVTDVNSPAAIIVAVQKAVAALFTDGTKTALANGVDQAAITTAAGMVAALADGVAEKAGLLADVQVAQSLLDNGAPIINDVSTIPGAELGKDTLKFSFSKLTNNSGIGVSKASKLSIKSDGLGLIGDFDLKANQTNSLLNSPLPTNLNLSNASFSAILEAIKGSDSITQQQALDQTDFTELFTLLKQTNPELKDAMLKDINFDNLFSAIHTTDPETRQRILDNIISIVDLATTDPHKSEFKSALISAFMNILPVLNAKQTSILFTYFTSGTSTKLTDLFNSLELTDTQKKDVLSLINYTKLFNGVLLLDQTTRTKIFDALNFTDILYNVKSSNSTIKGKVYGEVLKSLDLIKDSSLSKVEVLNTIALGDINRAALFKVLDNLDGHIHGFVTIEATLTDDQNQANKYTIRINP